MSDEWMPSLRLNLTRADFDRLPRHPSYRYEFIDGVTCISPWPRYAHANLRLRRFRPGAPELAKAELRPASLEDLHALVPILVGAFARLQPFGALDQEKAHAAAERSLKQTFVGGDGPLIESASFVAQQGQELIGAIFITLLPGGDPADPDSFHWPEPAPPDVFASTQGQPHLTWIFVKRFSQGTGVGTQLLRQAVRVLKKQGYQTLWTTFQQGNDSSMLWHWRNGFELLPHLFSKRRLRAPFAESVGDE